MRTTVFARPQPRRAFFLVALLCTGFASEVSAGQTPGRSQPGAPTVEAEVLRASEEWFSAFSRRDVDALDRMTVDDFLWIQQVPSGVAVVTKDLQIANLRKGAGQGSNLRRELSAIRVRTYGDTAILTALASFTSLAAGGRAAAAGAMISEVWIRRPEGWRVSHFQTTDVPVKPSN